MPPLPFLTSPLKGEEASDSYPLHGYKSSDLPPLQGEGKGGGEVNQMSFQLWINQQVEFIAWYSFTLLF